MRHISSALLAGALALGTVHVANAAAAKPKPFTLTSTAFKDGGKLAVKNAGNIKENPNCVGENVSPPFAWNNVPEGTKSFVLFMFDPEGRNGLGVSHWVAYGIPASVTGFAEGETSKESDKYVGGKGTAGKGIYLGPCTPPNTDWHHYTFTLVATDLDPKAIEPGMTREQVLEKLNGHGKGTAGLIGRFKHP